MYVVRWTTSLGCFNGKMGGDFSVGLAVYFWNHTRMMQWSEFSIGARLRVSYILLSLINSRSSVLSSRSSGKVNYVCLTKCFKEGVIVGIETTGNNR